MSICKKGSNGPSIEACPRMPWMMKLEDDIVASDQLSAAYQSTNIDHKMRLNVESSNRPGRLTKIVVTLGSENSHPDGICKIIAAGANVIRLNMSHANKKWHGNTVRAIRESMSVRMPTANQEITDRRNIQAPAIAVDLRGPEIRTGLFNGDPKTPEGRASFAEGDVVRLLTDERSKRAGDSTVFWISCPDFPKICDTGDRVMLNCGAVALQVARVDDCCVECTVTKGGTVSNETIVNPIDTVIDLPDISKRDDSDIKFCVEMECDFIVASHVRNSQTITKIRDRVKSAGTKPICILAKISSKQALDTIDDILKQADGIVIDRRLMELDVGPEKLFIVEKLVIAKCNRVGKPVIVRYDADMNEDGGTKLDLSNVANVVLEGADGIFLATGSQNAEETVNLLRRVDLVCREAENARWQRQIFQELSQKDSIPVEPSHSIAIAAVELSLKCNASGIIVITTTGRTAMLLSIYRPRCPVVAITRHGIVARWLQIYFAIHPLHYTNDPDPDWRRDMDERIQNGMRYLRCHNCVKSGDPVVIVSGWRRGSGFTNCIRVVYASPRYRANNVQDFEEIW